MNVVRHIWRRRRLKGLEEMPPPNPREAQWRRPRTAGQRMKQVLAVVAVAYGVAGALLLTALLSRNGPTTVLMFMADVASETWRWATKLAGMET